MTDPIFDIFYNGIKQEVETVGQDFFRDMLPVLREKRAFTNICERYNAQIASRLRMEREVNNLSEESFVKALEKMSNFIYAMEGSFNPEEEHIDYETLIEDSIVVKFRSHPKMRLNIYFDEESLGDDNPEESYLLYEKQGRMTLVSDTIRNNVGLIRELLSL